MNIFITGITGTIGQAFEAYLQKLGHTVTGVDHNEDRVSRSGTHVHIGDFSEWDLYGQDVVIHLAAFKHIDLCEKTPSACINNNVIKTYRLFRNAEHNKVDIVFMSTDKAVEPCSIYGYSKALMEGMALELGGAVIRSGNVLSSHGSVLTLWEKAIENGEPLKITDPRMIRYFISPENLAERTWKLYLDGQKLIIPEMDMHVSLMELVDNILSKYGESIETYPIIFTGLRPGEKLEEKLTNGNT